MIALGIRLLGNSVIILIGNHVFVDDGLIIRAGKRLQHHAYEARAVLALCAVHEIGPGSFRHGCQTPDQLGPEVIREEIHAHGQRNHPALLMQLQEIRGIEIALLDVICELFFVVRKIDDRLYPDQPHERVHIRSAVVLIVAGRGGTVEHALPEVSHGDAAEIGENNVVRILETIIQIVDVTGFLNRKIFTGLRQRHRGCILLREPGQQEGVFAAADTEVKVGIARITYDKRLPDLGIVAAVVGNILDGVSVGKSDIQAVPKGKAQGAEVVGGDHQIGSAEFGFVQDANIRDGQNFDIFPGKSFRQSRGGCKQKYHTGQTGQQALYICSHHSFLLS